MGLNSFKGAGAIPLVGRTVRLKIVNTNLFWRMEIPSRFREQRRNMTGRTLCLPVEKFPSASGCVHIEASSRRLRSGYRELVKVQRRKLRSDQIRRVAHVVKSRSGCDWKLSSILEPRIEKCTFPVHFQISYESIPVG